MEPTASAFLDSNLKNLYTLTPSKPQDLHRTSTALLSTFRHGLRSSRETMLPSYIHRLPTGREKGTAIALDLGGSNLRVAVIQLLRHGRIRGDGKSHMDELMTVVDRRSWKVTDDVKGFVSREFFDWIADKIEEVVGAAGLGNGRGTCMGVTWSFPIESVNTILRFHVLLSTNPSP